MQLIVLKEKNIQFILKKSSIVRALGITAFKIMWNLTMYKNFFSKMGFK